MRCDSAIRGILVSTGGAIKHTTSAIITSDGTEGAEDWLG
jgi:hypothetical protein